MEKRKQFTAEQKANIVLEMLRGEKTAAEIAAQYEVHPTQLHRWKTEAIENMPSLFTRGASELEKMRKQHEAEKEELTKQIGQLTIEVNWLKKNLLNSTSAVERREMVERNHPEISVKRQSELLEVNRTSVYYKPSEEADKDIELMHLIDEIYTRWPHYGYRRIRAVLRDMGYMINKKRVLRLMRRMGIAGLCPGPNLSKRNHQHHTYPYLLRGVKAERPDHIWGIDITYIRMKGSFMYLVAIIDWYSRYVVSWELSQTLERSFVMRALKKALAVRKPEIINSDQGSHFTCSEYIELLKRNGIQISMDGKGRATDNAITERFFRNLKWEKIYYEEYRKPREVYRAVRTYIDEYNYERPHQAIRHQKPADLYFSQLKPADITLATT